MSTYNFWRYTNNKEEYVTKLNDKVDEIATKALKKKTKYGQIKYAHDYIVNHTDYDYEAADNNNNTITNLETDLANTAYGSLVNGKAVCGGYAKAFSMVLHRMGYTCSYVRGDAFYSDGTLAGPHAWNYLKADGEYYYMDITWDDPVYKNEPDRHGVVYNYFCITSDQISIDHKIEDEDTHAPYTSATKYAYRG